MADSIFIQIRFVEDTAYGQYSDALYFTQEEYLSKSGSEIQAMKQARIDKWIEAIENPSPPEVVGE